MLYNFNMLNLKNNFISKKYLVDESKTARVVASGGLDVLASPEIIRLVENMTFEELEKHVEEGFTTVGGYIDINHLKPTPINACFKINIIFSDVTEKKIEFIYEVYDEKQLVANGKHIRFVINKERFLKKIF